MVTLSYNCRSKILAYAVNLLYAPGLIGKSTNVARNFDWEGPKSILFG